MSDTSPGTVRVVLRIPLPPEQVWPALAERDRLAQWFGDLGDSWLAGRRTRVEFGDGDFFDIDIVEVSDRSIRFDWSFLGVGPTARVLWRADPAGDGSTVVVEDVQPGRTPAEAEELRSGWTDFIERLSRYLTTGHRSRYGARNDIDGTIDVAGPAGRLIVPDVIHRWLPIATDGFAPKWFFIVDDEGPRRFAIDRWTAGPDEVDFAVEVPGATRITEAHIALGPAGPGAPWHLSFRHTGWARLGLPDRQARLLRSRFTAAWVTALRDARALAIKD